MGKKVKKDEKPPPDDVFDPLLVESRQAATVVLMLKSPEEDVQSKACEAVYKFVDKCDENKKLLLDLKAVDPLLQLMQGEDATVRRHATMALGVMCQHPDVRKYLRKKLEAIPTFINLLQPEAADAVVHEFAALALSYMSTEFSSKVTIFDHGGIEPLVKLLTSYDPDVQKNSIEALAQLSLDYQVRGSIREYEAFPPILAMLNSEYAIIQKLALLTLDRLMQDVENRSTMRELEGITKLLDVLAKPEWNDLHVMVMMVISSLLEDLESLEQMKESGGLKRLVALITDQNNEPAEDSTKKGDKKGGSRAGKKSAKDSQKGKKAVDDEEKDSASGGESIIPTLPDVKMCAAKAIARCARSSENRKILHEQEAEKMLIILLAHESPEVQGAAAQAIGIMCENLSVRDTIREFEGLAPLVKLLNTDMSDVKEAVTLALANLTSSNIPNCQEIVNMNGLDPLIQALSDVTEEVAANAACVLTNMAQDEGLRSEAQAKSVVTALIEPLKCSNPNVQSKAALAVSAFACDAASRVELLDSGGLQPLVALLHSGNDEVRRNAAWAITVAGVDESTATEICRLGGLEILQQIQLSSTRHSPFIDTALERLLDSNLSAKYALTGQLTHLNFIEDGFYDPGQLRPGTKLQTLTEYLSEPLNDKRPIFYISAKQESKPEVISQLVEKEDTDNKSDSRNSVKGKPKQEAKGKTKAQREKEEKQKEEELAAQLQKEAEKEKEKDQQEPRPPEPPLDLNFVKYIEEVSEKVASLPTTREQIVALAQFVAEKMGGPIEKGQLTYFGWELPMSQLRFESKSNVVPIGKIKMGIHTHRALLFKAIADRLSIGCTLTRGLYNRAWNEVLITADDATPGVPKYPPVPVIVDLIHEPGRLLLLDSKDAVAYQKI